MKSTVAGLAAALALLGAGSAHAQDKPINKDGMTAPEVAAWMTELGYKAELDKDGDGDPMIRSESDGIKFNVYFYDCEKDRCRAIQFSTGFDLDDGMPLDKINEWNRDKRYMKAFLDDENDPYVQYDVNVAPGATQTGLKDNFEIWIGFLPLFAQHIGW